MSRENRGDREAWESCVRTAVLCAGARVLEKVLHDVGCGRAGTPVVCECGRRMRSAGVRTKRLQTILGTIPWRRSLYLCPECGASRFPGDETLGVEGTGFLPGLRRLMARAGYRTPFGEAEEDLHVYAGIRVNCKEIERVAETVGGQIERWMATQRATAMEAARRPVRGEAAEPIPVLYVSFDGTGVPMRRTELKGRKGKGPDGKAKTREVKLGCVFTQTITNEQGRAIRDPGSTTYTGAIESSERFGWRIFAEAQMRGLERARQVVVLTDGARYNKTIVQMHFPEAIHIIDLYHAREHLYAAVKLLVPEAQHKARQRRWLKLLDQGHIEKLVEAMAKLLPSRGKRRKKALLEIGYFKANAKQMRYAEYRAQGLFVGSGVIEAGCRTLIGQRLKRSGMFWSLPGANAIIASRCCQYSGHFETFWEQTAA